MDITVKTLEYVSESGDKFPIRVVYENDVVLAIHFADFFTPLPNGTDYFVGRDWYLDAVRQFTWHDETKHYADWLGEILDM